jgi:penicillin-binding protein 2
MLMLLETPSSEAKLASGSAAMTTERIQVGCKTGTAESHGVNTNPHAWFTVFAPYENPEIVLTVLVEEGGQGSDIAAPIAKELLTSYFGRTQ